VIRVIRPCASRWNTTPVAEPATCGCEDVIPSGVIVSTFPARSVRLFSPAVRSTTNTCPSGLV